MTSFVDAQDQITKELRKQRFMEETRKYLQQLLARAHIVTIFDSPAQTARRQSTERQF